MCYERRRAEACVDESAHHALWWEFLSGFFEKTTKTREKHPKWRDAEPSLSWKVSTAPASLRRCVAGSVQCAWALARI